MPLSTSVLRVASGAVLTACAVCGVPPATLTASYDAGPRTRPGPIGASVERRDDPADRTGPDRPETDVRVALGPGGRDIRLAGDLTEGVAARVRKVLDAHPRIERIHLTSDGGLVDEAVALGALIAERGLDTYVPDACASACTLAFVRGRRRYLLAGAGLGFHAPYEDGPAGALTVVDPAPERVAYLGAGVDPSFVTRALSVPPDDIWIPDAALLGTAGVVTEVVGSDRFPDSTLDADPGPRAARAVVLRDLPVLAEADGGTVETLAEWYHAAYGAGRSEADAIEGLRRLASDHLRRRFLAADDATVRALGQDILAALRTAGGDACAPIAGGDLVAVDEAIRSARPAAAGLGPLVARTGRPEGPASGNSVRAEEVTRARPGPSGGCASAIAETGHALDRPPREAAAAVRSLFLRGAASEVAGLAGP